MSKHTEQLQALGNFSINQLLALGIKLGGPEQVRRILACSKVAVKFVSGEEAIITGIAPAGVVLQERDQIQIPSCSKLFVPGEYFQIRSGLEISTAFREYILPATHVNEKSSEQEIRVFDLIKDATDEQIRAELPERYIFEATEFCYLLAQFIECQSQGQEGSLLTKGWINLFYVQGMSGIFVVFVDWDDFVCHWDVSVDEVDGNHWHVGYRVFSRN